MNDISFEDEYLVGKLASRDSYIKRDRDVISMSQAVTVDGQTFLTRFGAIRLSNRYEFDLLFFFLTYKMYIKTT